MTKTAVRLFTVVMLGLTALVAAPATAEDPPVSQNERFTASDGVTLETTVSGAGPLTARPTLVEFSPYGRNSGTLVPGPDYNSLLVQLRGTGDSDGSFDALGPRTQKDVVEVLRWACNQPWSNGSLAINGFSASAITVYNSLHQELPCVKAMVLKSGTFELYRDLLVPGGIVNIAPGAGVLALIGAPALIQGTDRLQRNPASSIGVVTGLFTAGINGGLLHPTLDAWWQERRFRGNANRIPTLVIDSWFDVESRGAFQGFQELRDTGAHLLVQAGHDGAPAGTDAGVGEARAWLDHYVRGVANGVETHPRVQALLARGSRQAYLSGLFTKYDAADWPVPGTTWAQLALDPKRAASGARSLNDGTLTLGAPATKATQSYLQVPSLPTAVDVPNGGLIGNAGLDALTNGLPGLADMSLAESLGLTYTTAPLTADVASAGPAALEVQLASLGTQTNIWAVISDVGPDGVAHPLTVGRLNSDYPDIDPAKSLVDSAGAVVQPYGRYDAPRPAKPGVFRKYQVELWPVGNVFEAGHRIRLHVVGASAASKLALSLLDSVKVGAGSGARLLLPVLPGSDLGAALDR